ncbi:MAG: sn-glycerol-3-phosphate ABC transporter ATP-binding protein UgpC [Planctomycetota bacterium]|jgi:multiple sugar transport system ATP-binding protein|nr:sn-glycerol-3-phosphate ABC transporter ATP-binding protein UgpC [Planctomycetota bacterium]
MASVVLESVDKFFGSVQVLHGVDLTIDDGSFVVLVGPSGCGKSTLLRMIAGLEEVSRGDILIDGKRVNDLPPKQRDLAMVFQSYALYPHMTVEDNMGFSLRLAKIDKEVRREQVMRAAEILDLIPYLGRYPRQLSGGQRQRVAMGRAIVRNPKVFLFDEPLSNLDAKLRGQMRTEIKALHHKLGVTTIYVTHDQTEAMTMADRIVVLRDGIVEQIGSPGIIYSDPDNSFVAGFIGTPPINFFDGMLRDGPDGQSVKFADGGRLKLPSRYPVADGRPVRVGIRPRHFIPCPDSPNAFRTMLVEPTGDDAELRGEIFGQAATIVLPVAKTTVWGDAIPVAVRDGSPVFLFDPNSGKRLHGE